MRIRGNGNPPPLFPRSRGVRLLPLPLALGARGWGPSRDHQGRPGGSPSQHPRSPGKTPHLVSPVGCCMGHLTRGLPGDLWLVEPGRHSKAAPQSLQRAREMGRAGGAGPGLLEASDWQRTAVLRTCPSEADGGVASRARPAELCGIERLQASPSLRLPAYPTRNSEISAS